MYVAIWNFFTKSTTLEATQKHIHTNMSFNLFLKSVFWNLNSIIKMWTLCRRNEIKKFNIIKYDMIWPDYTKNIWIQNVHKTHYSFMNRKSVHKRKFVVKLVVKYRRENRKLNCLEFEWKIYCYKTGIGVSDKVDFNYNCFIVYMRLLCLHFERITGIFSHPYKPCYIISKLSCTFETISIMCSGIIGSLSRCSTFSEIFK